MTEKAFPVSHDCGNDQGMTLRDYFAARAMQGWMVGVEMPKVATIARVAYEMADAMLEARE